MGNVIKFPIHKRQPLPPGWYLTQDELSDMIDEVAEEIGWIPRKRHLKIVKKVHVKPPYGIEDG